MWRDSRGGDSAGRGQVFTGHRGPRESLPGREQHSYTLFIAQDHTCTNA